MSNKAIIKYLEQYAEPEVAALSGLTLETTCQNTLVIPAYKEDQRFLKRLIDTPKLAQKLMLILVINQPDTDVDLAPQQALFRYGISLGKLVFQRDTVSIVYLEQLNSYLTIVDRFTSPIPHKLGVGQARKIGVDLALAFMASGLISGSWVHSTDADATLPDNYFDYPNYSFDTNCVALTYAFNHSSQENDNGQNIDSCQQNNAEQQKSGQQPSVAEATQQYQLAMSYYKSGLAYAGSPYAFFTIGSILAFSAQAYARVRGFPKRSAGEDFYLLNKLAKLGTVEEVKNASISLDARLSDRVPFGTGPAVLSIINDREEGVNYHYYHPQVFLCLKEARKFLFEFDRQNDAEQALESLSSVSQQALVEIGVLSFIAKQKNQSVTQYQKQVDIWFDAFKTLKFIHAVRDIEFENIPLEEGIATAPFDVV